MKYQTTEDSLGLIKLFMNQVQDFTRTLEFIEILDQYIHWYAEKRIKIYQ